MRKSVVKMELPGLGDLIYHHIKEFPTFSFTEVKTWVWYFIYNHFTER